MQREIADEVVPPLIGHVPLLRRGFRSVLNGCFAAASRPTGSGKFPIWEISFLEDTWVESQPGAKNAVLTC
jgi:hypothetical protein